MFKPCNAYLVGGTNGPLQNGQLTLLVLLTFQDFYFLVKCPWNAGLACKWSLSLFPSLFFFLKKYTLLYGVWMFMKYTHNYYKGKALQTK